MAGNRVAIIGAGIGGLTAAIVLRRKGFRVTVYEQTPSLAPVGSGISLACNAMAVLDWLGLRARVEQAGVQVEEFLVSDTALNPVQRVSMNWMRGRFGYGMVTIRRGDLHAILAEALGPEHLVQGKRFQALEQTGQGVTFRFADGSLDEADWLLGADGIHSRVRACLFGKIPLRYSGQTCFRGLVPFELPEPQARKGYEIWGRTFRLGFVNTRPGEVYYFCVTRMQPGTLFGPPAARALMAEGLAGFPPFVRELAANTPDDTLIQTDLYDFPPLPRWHEGRAGLIGDAAHATTPNLGQGGAQAIEDGYFLDQCSDGAASRIGLEDFFRRRHAKTARITRDSYRFGQMAHLRRLGALRNWVLRRVPQWVTHRQGAWILRL